MDSCSVDALALSVCYAVINLMCPGMVSIKYIPLINMMSPASVTVLYLSRVVIGRGKLLPSDVWRFLSWGISFQESQV